MTNAQKRRIEHYLNNAISNDMIYGVLQTLEILGYAVDVNAEDAFYIKGEEDNDEKKDVANR